MLQIFDMESQETDKFFQADDHIETAQGVAVHEKANLLFVVVPDAVVVYKYDKDDIHTASERHK